MPKFEVVVARAYWHEATVQIEAKNGGEAFDIAWENRDDYELQLGDLVQEVPIYVDVRREIKNEVPITPENACDRL